MELVQGGDGTGANLFGGAGGWDGDEQVEMFVELDEQRSAVLVGFEADGDGFGTVVFALVGAAPQ
jgi:hypothetical protein